MARSTNRGGWPPVRWRTHARNAVVGAWATPAAAVLLAPVAGAELVPLGPGTLLGPPFEATGEEATGEWDNLVRTCDARVAAWYLVPLAVTTNCGLMPREPAPAADEAADDASGAAAAKVLSLADPAAGDELEDIDPLVRDIPYPMPAITTSPAITEVTALIGIERNP